MASTVQTLSLQRADAARILVFTGIALLAINMVLGEVFAIFISHVANGEIRERWVNIVAALQTGDTDAIRASFARVEFLLERRGRIINTHSHLGAFGVLALSLALIQSLLPFSERTKRRLAVALAAGAIVQPLFVFVSSYVGSWANWVADLGGLLIVVGLGGMFVGLLKSRAKTDELAGKVTELLRSASSRLLCAAAPF